MTIVTNTQQAFSLLGIEEKRKKSNSLINTLRQNWWFGELAKLSSVDWIEKNRHQY